MTNYRKNISLLLFCSIIAVASMSAQKYGYINSTLLLTELPDVKAADAELQTYQKQLISKGEQMVKTFETKYTKYSTEAQSGEFSPLQIQQKEGELAAEQEKIKQYEVTVQNQIGAKREELYKPILDKVRVAVDEMGKAQGYTMIFDTSGGALLYAEESSDLMTAVKAKLGL